MPRLEACLDLDIVYLNYLKKLKIFTVLDFVNSDTDKLTCSVVSAGEVLSLKHKLISQCVKSSESGFQRYSSCLKKSAVIPTHIEQIDSLLNGGLETGHLYEIVGLSGVGKTQICFAVVANVVSKLKRKVFYVDTKDDFSAKRIYDILEFNNYSKEDISSFLEKIDVFRARNLFDLVSIVYHVKEVLRASRKYEHRLLIMDSVTALYLEFIGSQLSNEGYSILMELGLTLKQLAVETYLSVIITNLAVRYNETEVNPGFGESDQMEGKMRPAMGRPWSHVPQTRLFLQQTNSPNISQLTVHKSNYLSHGKSCLIDISFGEKT